MAYLLLSGTAAIAAPAVEGRDTAAADRVPAARSHLHDCRRLSAVAGRLGETLAGHRIRETIVANACALTSMPPDLDPVWPWPWRDGTVAAELPPLAGERFGAWQVHCGLAGHRRRCALVTEMTASPARGGQAQLAPHRLVTHFVVDTIAGRETLIWRVLVVRDAATGPYAAIKRIEYHAGEKFRVEALSACGSAGCLAEASISGGEIVAAGLATGRDFALSLPARNHTHFIATLPADGFRAGLDELTRLRRDENQSARKP